MSIEFRIYRTGRDGFYESPGKMILSDKKAYFPFEDSGEEPEEFNYSPVQTWIDIVSPDRKKVRHPVNFLFTEQHYRVGQREMFAHLGFIQRQKLKWMYRDHWLQRQGNMVHFFIIILIISILLICVSYLELSGFF